MVGHYQWEQIAISFKEIPRTVVKSVVENVLPQSGSGHGGADAAEAVVREVRVVEETGEVDPAD